MEYEDVETETVIPVPEVNETKVLHVGTQTIVTKKSNFNGHGSKIPLQALLRGIWNAGTDVRPMYDSNY